jgi:hypothetical protein
MTNIFALSINKIFPTMEMYNNPTTIYPTGTSSLITDDFSHEFQDSEELPEYKNLFLEKIYTQLK